MLKSISSTDAGQSVCQLVSFSHFVDHGVSYIANFVPDQTILAEFLLLSQIDTLWNKDAEV